MADTGLLCIIGVGGDPRYRSCCKPGKLTHPWGNKTPNIPSRSREMLTYSSGSLQSVKSETAGGLSDSESHQEKGNSLIGLRSGISEFSDALRRCLGPGRSVSDIRHMKTMKTVKQPLQWLNLLLTGHRTWQFPIVDRPEEFSWKASGPLLMGWLVKYYLHYKWISWEL